MYSMLSQDLATEVARERREKAEASRLLRELRRTRRGRARAAGTHRTGSAAAGLLRAGRGPGSRAATTA